jgi:DNA invertase Pin-like site-specific DNA recombinase
MARARATVAYLRVSSRAQITDTQRHSIEGWAAARGLTIDEWVEERVSGRSLARPRLTELRASVAAGAVGQIVVYRLDRLCRSGVADVFSLLAELRAAGVTLVSVADGFDLNSPVGDLLVAASAWLAAIERALIEERTAAARARVEESGGRWGRPRRLDPEQEARVLELAAEGRSIRGIAVALKVPRSTVARVVARGVPKTPPIPAVAPPSE